MVAMSQVGLGTKTGMCPVGSPSQKNTYGVPMKNWSLRIGGLCLPILHAGTPSLWTSLTDQVMKMGQGRAGFSAFARNWRASFN